MAKAPEHAAKSQRDRFIEAARQSGAVEDEAIFEQQLKTVAGRISPTGAKKSRPKPEKAGRK